MMETEKHNQPNVRAPHYGIARAIGTCTSCAGSGKVFALALPPGHEILVPRDDEAIGHDGQEWQTADHGAFIFHIEVLGAAVAERLRLYPSFRRMHPIKNEPGIVWANHCEHCGAPFSDQELFCEPDGAFFPTSESGARAIRVLSIDGSIEGTAAGYACAPAYFHALGRD